MQGRLGDGSYQTDCSNTARAGSQEVAVWGKAKDEKESQESSRRKRLWVLEPSFLLNSEAGGPDT